MSTTLHKVDDEFQERNMFLQVTLGLVSLAQQFDDVLGRCGLSAAPGALSSPDASPDDRALDALLGLVALSQRLMVHVQAACANVPATPAAGIEGSPASGSISLRGLLA